MCWKKYAQIVRPQGKKTADEPEPEEEVQVDSDEEPLE
jgi:hypothetical protein